MLADDVGLLAVGAEADDGDVRVGLGIAAEGVADGVPDAVAVAGGGGDVDAGDGEIGLERQEHDRLFGLEAEQVGNGRDQLVRGVYGELHAIQVCWPRRAARSRVRTCPCARLRSSEPADSRARFGRALIRKARNRPLTPATPEVGIVAGQRTLSAVGRSRPQRSAIPRNVAGVFPMTQHVECVALLERAASDLR